LGLDQRNPSAHDFTKWEGRVMSDTKHTPTPYFVSERDGVDINFIHPNKREYMVARAFVGIKNDAEANAAFIVRACNCHDELVEALEKLLDLDWQILAQCDRDNSVNPRLAKARSALAKARGDA
jgi:hypothetical protein